ncbi:MAG TPA: class I SAM-dependent methyltransferase [Terriglobales bacterium]|nr:class I SAM-dependent methyltransferase [Terriglobales bacterium]
MTNTAANPTLAAESAPYTRAFYEQQQQGSYQSALRVLPQVLQLIPVRSVVDVGCGVAAWLAAAQKLGVDDVLGIDGDYVDRSTLLIAAENFCPRDLTRPFGVDRVFDLAMSLEVAEHLPASSAESFIESLVALSPVILFSAAVPAQTGTNHINEQWPTWWIEHFRKFGFVPVDCIRRRIWNDPKVEWWYAQNTLLMVRDDYLQSSPLLLEEARKSAGPFAIVHPRAFRERLASERRSAAGFRQWLAAGPSVIRASASRILRRLTRSTLTS